LFYFIILKIYRTLFCNKKSTTI